MQISEKILLAKQDLDEVYAAGYAKGVDEGGGTDGAWYYAVLLRGMFMNAVFSEEYQLVLKMRSVVTDMYGTFAYAKNLKSIKIATDDKETVASMSQTFRECTDLEVVDLTEHARKISKADYLFFGSHKVRSVLGALDMSGCTDNASLAYAFFAGSLQDVEFVPGTIKADIRFNSSYLTDASIESIINGLADLTGGAAQTITLNGVGAKLTESQRGRISAKNWTLAY